MELFMSKLRQFDLPPVLNILRLITIPAAIKLHEGLFPAVLRQEDDQTRVVGLCFRRVVAGVINCCLVGTEATAAPDVGTHVCDTG